MAEDQSKIECEVNEFFQGFTAALTSHREVMAAYDEQVAFEFNATSFFWPGEVKISEILAFFLDPNKSHGQKCTFLKILIQELKPQNCPPKILDDLKAIAAVEDPTGEGRRIDIVITLSRGDGEAQYVIGLENKIGTAADGTNQIKDYAKDLRKRVFGSDKQWTLFYLTPDGIDPPEHSVPKEEFEELLKSGNVQVISYHRIVALLGQFEVACKAENVRAFLRDFKQYVKKHILKEPSVNETNWIREFLRKHSNVVAHWDSLQEAINLLKEEHFQLFWKTVAEVLRPQGFTFGPEALEFDAKQYRSAVIASNGGPVFAEQGDLDVPLLIWNDSSALRKRAYLCIRLRKNLDSALEAKREQLKNQLQLVFKNVCVFTPTGPHCGGVPLTHPQFGNGAKLCEFLQDKGRKMRSEASRTAMEISEYIRRAEKAWREIGGIS